MLINAPFATCLLACASTRKYPTVSQPRNPNILRFFKLAKLSENGGYGIDKINEWKQLTGYEVSINSSITYSEVIFTLPINANQHQLTPKTDESGGLNGGLNGGNSDSGGLNGGVNDESGGVNGGLNGKSGGINDENGGVNDVSGGVSGGVNDVSGGVSGPVFDSLKGIFVAAQRVKCFQIVVLTGAVCVFNKI